MESSVDAMNSEDPELLKLIGNEVSLANTFLQTYRLASSRDHAVQALTNAQAAYEAATRFVAHLPPEIGEKFHHDLRKLRQCLAAVSEPSQNES
ncbi:MAG: hypothetical protein ACJ746_05030 [Bryobacteraceae bacterium]